MLAERDLIIILYKLYSQFVSTSVFCALCIIAALFTFHCVFYWWVSVQVQVILCKFHSVFLTSTGRVLTCGLGRGGRLGHGNELTLIVS